VTERDDDDDSAVTALAKHYVADPRSKPAPSMDEYLSRGPVGKAFAPDPAPTGYLPGMAFGTGGNRLDPAPLDLDDTLYAESDSIARRVERPTVPTEPLDVTAHPDYCPCGRVAFRPQPLGGRMQAVRCGGCNRTLGNCNCAAQPDSEAKR